MVISDYITPVMYIDSNGYSLTSIIDSVKKWFHNEYWELFFSFGAAFGILSYVLPNGFALAAGATLSEMFTGLLIASAELLITAGLIYGGIKYIQYLIDNTHLIEPGPDSDIRSDRDAILI